MKFFVVLALCVAAASAFAIPPIAAGINPAEIQQIIDAINHPSTDPATAAALEDMLNGILGIVKPEPGAEEEVHPIQTLPAIIDESIITDESAISPIQTLPALVDESIFVEPANYQPRPPLVQVIVNVNGNVAGNPVVVEQPSPAIIPEDIIVVEQPEIKPEPVIIAPIVPAPVITLPEILN